jgi:hypothetical protein
VATKKAKKMDPKLAILFVLIGTIIALSHLNEESVERMKRQIAVYRWRGFMPLRRKT